MEHILSSHLRVPAPPLGNGFLNCSLNVSGQSRFLHKLLAALPKRINSMSDILRKRVCSCSSSSLGSIAIDMPVSRQRWRLLYQLLSPVHAQFGSIAALAVNDDVIARRFYSGQFDF